MLSAHPLLKTGLRKSKAPITRRQVACVLETKSGAYAGWNRESARTIRHAETEALKRIPKGEKITRVHLMGNGGVAGIKHAIPCEACLKALIPHTEKSANITLYHDTNGKSYTLPLSRIARAYKALPRVSRPPFSKLASFLDVHTPLTRMDTALVIALCNEIAHHNTAHPAAAASIYLTGTASGRSGPKTIIAPMVVGKAYEDIDMLLIFPRAYPKHADAFVKTTYKAARAACGEHAQKIISVSKPSYKLEARERDTKGFLFRREYRALPPSRAARIDVSVGRSLGALVTKRYLKKNWLLPLM